MVIKFFELGVGLEDCWVAGGDHCYNVVEGVCCGEGWRLAWALALLGVLSYLLLLHQVLLHRGSDTSISNSHWHFRIIIPFIIIHLHLIECHHSSFILHPSIHDSIHEGNMRKNPQFIGTSTALKLSPNSGKRKEKKVPSPFKCDKEGTGRPYPMEY